MQPHPHNDGFAWSIPGGPYRAVTDAQAAQFDECGYVLVEGALASAPLDDVEAELDTLEAAHQAALRDRGYNGRDISDADSVTFTAHAVARSEVCRSFVQTPVLLDLCRDLLGERVSLYWDQAVYKKPEKPRPFPWHQDNGYVYVEPQHYLTCWIPLTDATVANGCPWIAPGVHRAGTLAHEYVEPLGMQCFADAPSSVAVEARRGDVVVFSSLTPHFTGPNTTDAVRKAYIVQYALTGSHVVKADGTREPCNAPDRQFPVLPASNGASLSVRR